MRALRHKETEDEGTILVLALAFLAVFGLVVGTVLGLASTNLRTTTVVRDRAATTYTADGAVDGAINAARSQSSIGVAGSTSTCFSVPAGTLNASAQVDVQCAGLAGSGTTTSPFPANASTPTNAILTPRPAVDTAEGVTMLNGSVARVQGPISTAHTLAKGTGTLSTTPASYSPITAETCTGTGTVTPTPTCTGTGSADPGYAPSLDMSTYPGTAQTFPSTLNTALPTCNANKVATFAPGMYTNLTAINTLMTSCAGGAFWFQPGTYYFDFLDTGTSTGANHDWTFNDASGDIVGGAALGWTPSTYVATGAAQLPYPSTDASASTSACDPSQKGVLFVFGNDSRFTLAKGHVQLCAYDVSTSNQHLAVWSPAANTTIAGSTANIIAGSNTTDSTAAGGVLWTNAQNGSVMGSGLLANVTANNTVPSSLTEAASQYTVPTAQIPSTATVTALTVKVFETLTGTGKSTITLKPPTSGTGVPTTAIPVRTVHDCTAGCSGPTYSVATETDITVPLTASSPTAEINGMGWVYSVIGATSYIDGIEFVADYTFPLRAPTGVVAAHPYVPGSATVDAVWSVVAAATTDRPVMAVHGTVYTPKAAVAFSETGVADALVDRGIIARDVYLGLLAPSAAYTGAHVKIPAQTINTQPRMVVFTAQRGGVDLLRAEVTFTDATGTVDGNVPKVLTWSLQ